MHGLVALMELNSSRLRARVSPTGAVVVLADQDRRMWDRLLIARGEAALRRGRRAVGDARPLRSAGRHCPLSRPRVPLRGDQLGRGGGAI